jgi:hypothetical protein
MLSCLTLALHLFVDLRTGAFLWRAADESNVTRLGFGIRPTPCVTTLTTCAQQPRVDALTGRAPQQIKPSAMRESPPSKRAGICPDTRRDAG